MKEKKPTVKCPYCGKSMRITAKRTNYQMLCGSCFSRGPIKGSADEAREVALCHAKGDDSY